MASEIDIVVKAKADMSGLDTVVSKTDETIAEVTNKWHSTKAIPMPRVEAFAEIDKYKTPIDEMATSLNTLGDAGTHAGGGASSGLSWAATAVGSFAGSLTAQFIAAVPQLAGDLFKAGEAATKVASGFETLGGKEGDLDKLKTATEGLVSDTDLMKAATSVMKSNFDDSVGSVEKILDVGGKLGEAFEGSATEGVDTFSKAIINVGSYTTLDDLGLDVDNVKTKFNTLKELMSDKDAWGMAIMQEADETIKKLPTSLDNAHPAIERFKAAIQNFRDTAGKAFTDWIDEALSKLERFNSGANVPKNDTEAMAALDSGMIAGDDSGPMGPPKSAADGSMGPPKSAGYGSAHSSSPRYGDVTGEHEGYGMYDHGGGGGTTRPTRIEKPTVTAAEFDAIVRSANAATAATTLFGATSAVAMAGLALGSAVAAGQVANLTTQGNAALSVFRQLEIQINRLASLTIHVYATQQATGGSRETTPARGPR